MRPNTTATSHQRVTRTTTRLGIPIDPSLSGETRTRNLRAPNAALYQLSYAQFILRPVTDRFIQFDSRKPKTNEVERILNNFFGAAAEIKRHGDRWLVTLPGSCSATFYGIEGAHPQVPARDERWIEVIYSGGGKALDVLTRQQDDYTCSLADGLAQALARFYQGKLEDD